MISYSNKVRWKWGKINTLYRVCHLIFTTSRDLKNTTQLKSYTVKIIILKSLLLNKNFFFELEISSAKLEIFTLKLEMSNFQLQNFTFKREISTFVLDISTFKLEITLNQIRHPVDLPTLEIGISNLKVKISFFDSRCF